MNSVGGFVLRTCHLERISVSSPGKEALDLGSLSHVTSVEILFPNKFSFWCLGACGILGEHHLLHHKATATVQAEALVSGGRGWADVYRE